MTIEELKDSGAIYFEKITEGMQQYDNQIVRMNEYQAVDKFTELWEACGCKNVHQMEHKEGQVLFQANEILFSICSRLNAAEMLFCTIYVTGEYPSTWWGNYNGEYIVFTKKEHI